MDALEAYLAAMRDAEFDSTMLATIVTTPPPVYPATRPRVVSGD
jgi:hypothetical protein